MVYLVLIAGLLAGWIIPEIVCAAVKVNIPTAFNVSTAFIGALLAYIWAFGLVPFHAAQVLVGV